MTPQPTRGLWDSHGGLDDGQAIYYAALSGSWGVGQHNLRPILGCVRVWVCVCVPVLYSVVMVRLRRRQAFLNTTTGVRPLHTSL